VKLETSRVMVTGAASGMGREFALQLARSGARVAAVDMDDAKLAALVEEGGGRIVSYQCDVSDEAAVVETMAAASAAFDGLDGLVNNAGIFRDGLLVRQDKETGTVKRMTMAQWNAVIAVDLTGPFLCTREFAAQVIERKIPTSVIVNVSSVARHGNPGQSNYSAAKAGLVADTKVWGVELARYGIRVGAVAPGFVDTPILQGMRPEVLGKMLEGVPLRRAASTTEIWRAVRFIFECDYFTSRCIDVDGGLTI
jgi:3-oxoacyl-[acyl-carrier protein] reductase